MIWTKSAIREARKAELVPILTDRSYRLYPLGNGNFRILPDPDDPNAPAGVIVKEHFWTWPEKNIAGNAIDFFTQVEGKSFHEAMEIILAATSDYDSSEPVLREDRGNVTKTAR